jgi:hypothetical protein
MRSDDRWLPVAFVVVELPVAFLYDRGLVDQRHSLSSFPLVLFAVALSVSWTMTRLRRTSPQPDAAAAAGGGVDTR